MLHHRAMVDPLRILCGREIQLSIKDSVKMLLDDKIRKHNTGYFWESTKNEIIGRNGSQFIFSGLGKMTVAQLKSYEGIDIFWGEEAQTFSEHSMEILIPTIRKPGSEIWFSWNPRHPTDPVDKLFRGLVIPKNAIIIKCSWRDNPFLSNETRAEMEFDRIQKPERFSHIWEGEYEPMAVGAIWSREIIHQTRRSEAPEMERILVSVDHAVSSDELSNEHGIIVGGLGVDGRGYVLEDCTVKGPPHVWSNRAVQAFDHWDSDGIVVERNQGGDLVKNTLTTVREHLPIIEVVATRGKHVRAEPIAALYGRNKISHVGAFPELEGQMCQMTAAGYEGEGSPDRTDAMVWLFTELFPVMTRAQGEPDDDDEPMGEGSWMG